MVDPRETPQPAAADPAAAPATAATAAPAAAVRRRALLASAGVLATGGALVPAALPTSAYAAPARRAALAPDSTGDLVRSARVAVPTGRTTRVPTDPAAMVAVLGSTTLPSLAVRARGAAGWGPWTALARLADGPGEGTPEGDAARAVHATDAVWLGPADAIEVRVGRSRERQVELVLIDPGTRSADRVTHAASPARPRGATGSGASASGTSTTAAVAPKPKIHLRPQWGADESWRTSEPRYESALMQVHVHHTVSATAYAANEVPAILRGIYRYHTKSLGWSDVGYNFFVDRFGRMWEGRLGGVDYFVRGAHTLGFNSSSTGVSAVSNFQTAHPSDSVLTAMAQIAAWKLSQSLGRAHGHVTMTSEGSDKFPRGTRVGLEVIDGHRDTNDTACPGVNLYNKLPVIRQRARAIIGN